MPATAETWTVFDEYWYDALGRRVAVRTRVDSTEHCTASETFSTPTACQQQFLRTTWDGDQVLFEERFVGGWQEVDGNVGESTPSTDWYGKVRYTQTGAIDAPVAVWRLAGSESWRPRVLHRNWRGNVAGATFGPGSAVGQVDASTVWPAAVTDLYLAPDARQSAPAANKWLGSLVTDGKDATGTLYRRNRYYDPASGRFTQTDPIGLAGGFNLFGYGGGDPINNVDPFGLCYGVRQGLDILRCILGLDRLQFEGRTRAGASPMSRVSVVGSVQGGMTQFTGSWGAEGAQGCTQLVASSNAASAQVGLEVSLARKPEGAVPLTVSVQVAQAPAGAGVSISPTFAVSGDGAVLTSVGVAVGWSAGKFGGWSNKVSGTAVLKDTCDPPRGSTSR